MHKAIIKEAASITRNQLLLLNPVTPFAKTQTLTTAARCVWFNDTSLAHCLVHKSTLIASHIEVVNGQVLVKDLGNFESAVSAAKLDFLELKKSEITLDEQLGHKNKKCHQIAAIDRMCKLWMPKGRQFCLGGIRLGKGKDGKTKVVTEPSARAAALAKAWSATFATVKNFDQQQAEQVLQHHCMPFSP